MKRCLAIAIALLCAVQLSAQDQVMYAHFIDMGQGLATMLQFPEKVIMIDAGAQLKPSEKESQKKVLDYLTKFFKQNPQYHNTIDAILITHNHGDHIGSIPTIHDSNIKIKAIVTSAHWLNEEHTPELLAVLKDPAIKEYLVDYRDILVNMPNGISNSVIDPLGAYKGIDPEITVYSGRNDYFESQHIHDNPNFHSLAIKVKFGKSSLLFTGDMEKAAINYMLEKYAGHLDVFDVDILQSGHHGSDNAYTSEFLRKVAPRIAVISAGHKEDESVHSGWDYGHPHDGTIDTLETIVSGKRAKKSVVAFHGKHNPVTRKITHQTYCTCWDNNIIIKATSKGDYSVKLKK